jgi:GAF domain-containing protein
LEILTPSSLRDETAKYCTLKISDFAACRGGKIAATWDHHHCATTGKDQNAVMNFSTTDQQAILDSGSAASVSAGIAAVNLLSTLASEKTFTEKTPRFPGEDDGRSLAEVAQNDLDAALQLLADRAQYITGASGAAIALRRGEHADMLCRATAGLNAPELGSLLSMEYGLSGESVRTGRSLRCDDAERDPRVNREGCRQLGIASVLIMPIISDRQVLGVFELFSGKPHAFDERDVSALQRLGEMVETAVKHAIAAQAPAVGFTPSHHLAAEEKRRVVIAAVPQATSRTQVTAAKPALAKEVLPLQKDAPEKDVPKVVPTEVREVAAAAAPSTTKPLFWSAAMRAQGNSPASEKAAEPVTVPPVLRKLPKCGACGFPVSLGRTFCVECEEKQWRGQRLPQPEVERSRDSRSNRLETPAALALLGTPQPAASSMSVSVLASAPVGAVGSESASPAPTVATTEHLSSAPIAAQPLSAQTSETSASATPKAKTADDSTPFLSSAVQSESWFGANKYVLASLFLVALVIGAIAWLR